MRPLTLVRPMTTEQHKRESMRHWGYDPYNTAASLPKRKLDVRSEASANLWLAAKLSGEST